MRPSHYRIRQLQRLAYLALFTMAMWGIEEASAATQSFLFVPSIPGESVEVSHTDWIDVTSYGLQFRESACSGLTLVKRLDLASPALIAATVAALHFPELRLETRRIGPNPAVFLQLFMTDALIAQINLTTPPATGELTEAVVIRSGQIRMIYTPQTATGTSGPAVESTLSCAL